METTYLIKKVVVSAKYLQEDVKSETPNSWANKPFSWLDLNCIASKQVDMIKNAYVKGFFSKLVVTISYTIVGGDDVEYCIDWGYDENGEVCCS
jgi:hypothetical protein